jgi:ubiquinol-cytochrome c reductase cytochrome c1 subunit
MRRKLIVALAAVGLAVAVAGTAAAVEAVKVPSQTWSFGGLFGTFDRGALLRGLQVYRGVCQGCHSLKLVAFRNLQEIGLTEDQVKKIAAEYEVTDGPNDQGEMFKRKGNPSDRFVPPFPNEKAARAANNGAYPPDLSVMVKARDGGADYLYALMTGYREPPAGMQVPEGMQYNAYFPGHQIAMPSPLVEDGVEYADKTRATVAQMARDVTTFLAWAAEPELEARKRMGVKVLLFILVLTGMLYAVKRKIWSDVH